MIDISRLKELVNRKNCLSGVITSLFFLYKMKKEEQIAKTYLEHIGYSFIDYEPDGNVPPDFVINGEIAVEVRRLNQHYMKGGVEQPLEELEYSLLARIRNLLNQYEGVEASHSVFVGVSFERPLKASKDLLKKVKTVLDGHLSHLDQSKKVKVKQNLTLTFYPASKRHKSVFLIGASSDGDAGGFIVADLIAHLPMIVREKEGKVQPYFSKYKIWWLVLIDNISYALDITIWSIIMSTHQ